MERFKEVKTKSGEIIKVREIHYDMREEYFIRIFVDKNFTYDEIASSYNQSQDDYDYNLYVENMLELFDRLVREKKFLIIERDYWISCWILSKAEYDYVVEMIKMYKEEE